MIIMINSQWSMINVCKIKHITKMVIRKASESIAKVFNHLGQRLKNSGVLTF